MTYPICVKAKNNVPPEDSRPEIMRGEIDLEDPDWKTIVETINEQLHSDDNWREDWFNEEDYY